MLHFQGTSLKNLHYTSVINGAFTSSRKAETKTIATRYKRSSDCASGCGRSEVPNLKPVRDGIDSLRIGLVAEELWEGGCTKKITNARFDVENIVPTKESQVWRQRTYWIVISQPLLPIANGSPTSLSLPSWEKSNMSRKGNCLDNAVAENFFGHFKEEFLRQRTFTNLGQFRSELETYIRWFNNDQIRLKLKGLIPVDYQVQRLANIAPTSN